METKPVVLWLQLFIGVCFLGILIQHFYFPRQVTGPLAVETVWEYKAIYIDPVPDPSTVKDDAASTSFDVESDALKSAGEEGWEVCGVYPETETKFPFVMPVHIGGGLGDETPQPNVRTGRVVVLLKRSHQQLVPPSIVNSAS